MSDYAPGGMLADLTRRLASEAQDVHSWSNGPGDRYARHDHPYTKVLYCAEGSIDFHLDDGRSIHLEPGDRMELPAGILHAASVGPSGVTCVEGKKASLS